MREKLNLFRYELKNALLGMIRHGVLCLSSITTITVTLILIAAFVLIGVHVDRFSTGIGNELSIHVVLNEDVTDPERLQQLETMYSQMTNVDHVVLSTKDDELEKMIAEKGDAFSIYRGENNPLSNAFFVYVEDESQIEKTANAFSLMPDVSSVAYGGGSVNDLVHILTIIRHASFGAALLMLLLSLYLIYNTIKTTIYSRADEISIMKTVGATPTFIRVPFEIEGILIGLLGAILPFALICWGYPGLYEAYGGRLFITEFQLLPVRETLWLTGITLFGLGVLSGWAASALAARKYLRRIR